MLKKLAILLTALFALGVGVAQSAPDVPGRSAAEAAAMRAVHGSRVEHTTVSGNFAVVSVTDGRLENAGLRTPLLLERFRFGWQPIELLDTQCPVRARIHDELQLRALLNGFHITRGTACTEPIDSGPSGDIEAIRAAMTKFVPFVHVADGYALAQWELPGGGVALYRKTGDSWKQLVSTGGALGVSDAEQFGIPKPVACKLGFPDAKERCP